MNKKEITDLAQFITEMANIPHDCPGKPNCTYGEGKLCCKMGAPYRIEKLMLKGIEEGIRNDALLIPDNDDDKRKYNVQLQHDGHNQLDRLRELLYRIDKEKTEKGELSTTSIYVAAEYMREHITKMRFLLNELYLNNKEVDGKKV